MQKNNRTSKRALIFSVIFIGVLVLSACGPTATPAPTQDADPDEAAQTLWRI
jgi:hypothetical protein